MSNVKLVFGGTGKGNTEMHELKVYANLNNEIFISLNANDDIHECFITLDKRTAIRFSKYLRKQIDLLED